MLMITPKNLVFSVIITLFLSDVVIAENDGNSWNREKREKVEQSDDRGWDSRERGNRWREFDSQAYRFRKMAMKMKWVHDESRRLNSEEERIDEMEERYRKETEKEDASTEAIERRSRIVDVRRELLQLEKEEFLYRLKEDSAKAAERIEAILDEPSVQERERLHQMLTKMDEFVSKVQDAKNFDELYGYIHEERGIFDRPAWMGEEFRQKRNMEEIQALRKRLSDLERETYGDFGPPPPPGQHDPLVGPPPHPGMMHEPHPMPGGPPPMVDERQQDRRKFNGQK